VYGEKPPKLVRTETPYVGWWSATPRSLP